MGKVTYKICDVCTVKLKSVKRNPDLPVTELKALLKALGIKSDDICDICITKSCENLKDYTMQSLSSKLTRNEIALAMRLRLCELVDKGTLIKDKILIQLSREFPYYTSIDSINKRISELMSKDEAYKVTGKLGEKYKGKVAKLDAEGRLYFP